MCSLTVPRGKLMKPPRVLVVDDDYLIRWAVGRSLADAGYDVTSAEDGLEAIQTAMKENFDFVITDVDMPGMGGLELLERLLELKNPPRVIVTSGRIDRDNVNMVTERGGWAYLEKSSSLIDNIKETLKEACAGGT